MKHSFTIHVREQHSRGFCLGPPLCISHLQYFDTFSCLQVSFANPTHGHDVWPTRGAHAGIHRHGALLEEAQLANRTCRLYHVRMSARAMRIGHLNWDRNVMDSREAKLRCSPGSVIVCRRYTECTAASTTSGCHYTAAFQRRPRHDVRNGFF